MLRCEIDHLVITASSLDDGAEYVRLALGVTPQVDGEQPLMGMQNCLVKLDDTAYLEVIAVDPAAPRPKRPRWYDLDALEMITPSCLTTWLARVDDIDASPDPG